MHFGPAHWHNLALATEIVVVILGEHSANGEKVRSRLCSCCCSQICAEVGLHRAEGGVLLLGMDPLNGIGAVELLGVALSAYGKR
ncbi:hypothetical protein BDW60DRAFT_181583 [Aspergillus nidulans var. acristatus]